MRISPGDRVPDAHVWTLASSDGAPQKLSTAELFAGRRVVLFAVPGPFTPACTRAHLPSFQRRLGELRARGVDLVCCVAVSDAFVMQAWAEAGGVAPEDITMLADGNGVFTGLLGLQKDASKFGMGTRSHRFALVAEDGVVRWLAVDEKKLEKTGGAGVLEALEGLDGPRSRL